MLFVKKFLQRVFKRFMVTTNVTNINVVTLHKSELLNDRYAVITGGSSGIGLEIAKAMLNAGASVVIIGRNSAKLTEALTILNKFQDSKRILGLCYDVTDSDNNLISKILKLIPRVDIFVNNAGILGGVFGYASEDEFDKVTKTNLRAPFMIAQEISKYFIKNKIKGNILNILSSSSIRPANSAYMATKWGMRGLTKGLAKQLIKHGIIVNGIAPGPTATPMLIGKDNKNYHHPSSPIHRYIMPEEIANMAVILTSALGQTIVGEVVYMTGGCGSITYDDINYNI